MEHEILNEDRKKKKVIKALITTLNKYINVWVGWTGTLVLIHLLNLLRAGSKRHTPAHRLSWRAKPREGVMFTLHHY